MALAAELLQQHINCTKKEVVAHFRQQKLAKLNNNK